MKALLLTAAAQNLYTFMPITEDNVFILKYILRQKHILQNLLALIGSTIGTPVKRSKATLHKEKKNYQSNCGLN